MILVIYGLLKNVWQQKELEITRMTQIFTNFSMKKYEIAINNKFA